MAHRQGFGALLADGAKALAAHYGVEELAVQVNGLDVAMHDPRAFSGMALSYVTSPRGACHNQSDHFTIEMGGAMDDLDIPMTDRFTDLGKAGYVARHQFWRTACNALTMCFFAVVPAQMVVNLLSAATGQDWTAESLLLAGERAWNLKRLINLRLGYTPPGKSCPNCCWNHCPMAVRKATCPISTPCWTNTTPPAAGIAPPGAPPRRPSPVWGLRCDLPSLPLLA